MSRLFVMTALVVLCAGCSKPEAPPTEQPPEPQAQAAQENTELRDAIQAPIERTKAVEGAVQDAAAQQKAAIEAQAGG